MRGIGRGMREFKDAKDNVKTEIEEGMREKDKDEEIRKLRQQLQQKWQQFRLASLYPNSPFNVTICLKAESEIQPFF